VEEKQLYSKENNPPREDKTPVLVCTDEEAPDEKLPENVHTRKPPHEPDCAMYTEAPIVPSMVADCNMLIKNLLR
jgi:hypothetical protein